MSGLSLHVAIGSDRTTFKKKNWCNYAIIWLLYKIGSLVFGVQYLIIGQNNRTLFFLVNHQHNFNKPNWLDSYSTRRLNAPSRACARMHLYHSCGVFFVLFFFPTQQLRGRDGSDPWMENALSNILCIVSFKILWSVSFPWLFIY